MRLGADFHGCGQKMLRQMRNAQLFGVQYFLLLRNVFQKPTKAVLPDRVEGIRLFVGDIKMDVPHRYIWHLPLKFKNLDLSPHIQLNESRWGSSRHVTRVVIFLFYRKLHISIGSSLGPEPGLYLVVSRTWPWWRSHRLIFIVFELLSLPVGI